MTNLSLSGNNFITLPSSITRLSELKYLKVVLHLKQLHIHQKYAMQCVGSISGIHCCKLAENINALKVFANSRLKFDVMVPGSVIPEWFSHQAVDFSIKVQLPHNVCEARNSGQPGCDGALFQGRILRRVDYRGFELGEYNQIINNDP
ncbi:hypothetical protein GOBAR_DD32612 [Gossypium barbadense]|nr:hypothetical protein GOBAR_DD32612 [Gossypium barbadense]